MGRETRKKEGGRQVGGEGWGRERECGWEQVGGGEKEDDRQEVEHL